MITHTIISFDFEFKRWMQYVIQKTARHRTDSTIPSGCWNWKIDQWLKQLQRFIVIWVLNISHNQQRIWLLGSLTSILSSCNISEFFSVLNDSSMVCFWIKLSVKARSRFSNSSWFNTLRDFVTTCNIPKSNQKTNIQKNKSFIHSHECRTNMYFAAIIEPRTSR